MSGNRTLVGLESLGQSCGVVARLRLVPALAFVGVAAREAPVFAPGVFPTILLADVFAAFAAAFVTGAFTAFFAAFVGAPLAAASRAGAFFVAVFAVAVFPAPPFVAAVFFVAAFPFAAITVSSATPGPRSLSYRSSLSLSGRKVFNEAWRSSCCPPMPR